MRCSRCVFGKSCVIHGVLSSKSNSGCSLGGMCFYTAVSCYVVLVSADTSHSISRTTATLRPYRYDRHRCLWVLDVVARKTIQPDNRRFKQPSCRGRLWDACFALAATDRQSIHRYRFHSDPSRFGECSRQSKLTGRRLVGEKSPFHSLTRSELPYTFLVTKRLKTWAVLISLSTGSVAAQLKIAIPKRHFQPKEQIQSKLENQSSRPITVCVEFGQWSPKAGTLESTPSPFLVEVNHDGRWSVLLNGPDIGSNSQSVVVDSGKSLDFPFRLNEKGTLRLRLDYWIGSKDIKCDGREEGARHLRSATFTVGG